MNRAQLVLILVAILLTIGIYRLPKVVVENEALEESQALTEQTTIPENHSLEMDSAAQVVAASLRESLDLEENTKIRIIFADSLGRLYLRYNMTDSASAYAQKIFEIDSGAEGKLKAGLLAYSAFEVTNSGEKARSLGELTRSYLEPLAEANDDASLKVKVGMTYMSTTNPMQGVLMIRGVLESDPNNTEALFNLGFLAIQSGQFDRAIERFEKVISLEPDNWNAQLYLGISLMELGEVDKAKSIFEKVVNKSNSEILNQIAQGYLQEIE